MTRRITRLVCVAIALGVCGSLFAQRPADDVQPDYEALKRLAQQLGGQPGQGQISPEMMELAKQFLKNNPDFVNSPAFQKQLAETKQKLEQNPALKEQYQKQLSQQFTPQEMEQLKKQFPNLGGGPNPSNQGMTPMGGQPRPSFQPPPSIPNSPIGPNPNGGSLKGGNPNGTGSNPQQQNPFGGMNPNGGVPNQNKPSASNPFTGGAGTPNTAKELAEKNPEFNHIVNAWEQTVGPMEKTPALKQSLVDMFSGEGKSPFGGLNGQGGNWGGMNGQGGKSWNGNNPNWNMNGPNNTGSGFGNWLKNMSANGGPNWWKNMSNSNWAGKSWFGNGPSNFTPPSTNGLGGGGLGGVGAVGGSAAGLGTFGMIVVLLIAAAVIGYLVYRYWPQIQAMRNGPKALPGFGPWPIDPREVKDRETLVRAFEYLSVAICGDGARVWNHMTIAEAFRENVPGAAPFADQLARLYAVARYTPAREEISPSDIAEARRYLCRLAGVSEV